MHSITIMGESPAMTAPITVVIPVEAMKEKSQKRNENSKINYTVHSQG
jgi:hypothetical protein